MSLNTKKSFPEDCVDHKPPAKRRKAAASLKVGESVEINDDALDVVMDFVGPRELYSLAFTCKKLLSRITTGRVVKSAMVHGGHAKLTIEELARLMKNQSIHPPSPLRLLRLVCGRQCEVCKRNRVNFVRPGYGVFFCWDCLVSRGTEPWKTSWVRFRKNPKYEEIFEHERVVAVLRGSKYYVWAKSSKYLLSEECIGPLVTFQSIENMAELPATTIDNYLNLTLQAPTKDDYADFLEAYEELKDRAQAIAGERLQKKQKAKEDAASRRTASVLKMVTDINSKLNDSCRDFVLDYRSGYSRYCIQFQSTFVDNLLKDYVRSPSKFKKKTLLEIADKLNVSCADLGNFLSFSFLDHTNHFEAKLKSFCLTKFSNKKKVFIQARDCFFAKLADKKPFEALQSLVNSNFGFLLTSDDEEDKRPVLAKNVWAMEFDTRKDYVKTLESGAQVYQTLKVAADEFLTWLVEKQDDKLLASFVKGDRIYSSVYFKQLFEKDFEDMKKKLENEPGFHQMWW
jgi:hypothetical protein